MITQKQWYDKLRSFVPRWFFEDEYYNDALFEAMARILATIDEVAQRHFVETFIMQAHKFFIDIQGDERTIPRILGEPDPLYAPRVQKLFSETDLVSIKKLVDSFLLKGECTIIEHSTFTVNPPCGLAFYDRNGFFNRRDIYNDRRYYNYFTIVIPNQVPVSNSFFDDGETFFNRSNFFGSYGQLPLNVLLNTIIAAVNASKAAGVMYRFIELP